jgi:hypothetical protein
LHQWVSGHIAALIFWMFASKQPLHQQAAAIGSKHDKMQQQA